MYVILAVALTEAVHYVNKIIPRPQKTINRYPACLSVKYQSKNTELGNIAVAILDFCLHLNRSRISLAKTLYSLKKRLI